MRPGPALAAALVFGAALPAAAAPGCAGGMVLPGTDTCVRLGGTVRAEAAAGTGRAIVASNAAPGGSRGRAALRAGTRVDLDARVPTAAGPIRAYLSVGAGGPAGR